MQPPEAQRMMRRVRSRPQRYTLALGLCAVVFAAFAFALYGLDGKLYRDDALYLYTGQLLARGIPPYVRCFDYKTPLTTFVAGGAVSVAQHLGWDDVLTVRAVFLIVGSLGAGALFYLGRSLFSSHSIAFLASLTLVAFPGWAQHAASGPRPKTLAVLFEILCLASTARHRWFAAGVWGGLATWTWQPLVIVPLTSAVAAVLQTQGIRERANALTRVVVGFLAPTAALGALLHRLGAWSAFVQLALVHPLTKSLPGTLTGMTILQRVQRLLRVLVRGYGFMAAAAVLGAAASVWILARHARRAGGLRSFLASDRLAGWALSWLALLLLTLWDFQGYVDLYVLLPFVALSLAWLVVRGWEGLARWSDRQLLTSRFAVALSCVSLAGVAIGQYGPRTAVRLEAQRDWATRIAAKGSSSQEGWLLSVGRPEILALLHETSDHPYAYFDPVIYERIQENSAGGLLGWLEQQLSTQPSMVVLGQMRPQAAASSAVELLRQEGYVRSKVGDWLVFRWEPEALAEPLEVQASDGMYGDRVQVTWTPVPRAERYEVYRSRRLWGARQPLAATAANRFEDQTADGCRSRYYWIVACDSERCSRHSVPDPGFVGGMAPLAPKGMHHVEGSGEEGLKLAWNWPAGTERFLLYRALPGQEGEQCATTRRAQYTEEGYAGDWGYQYWVEACNACGCSAPSRRTRALWVGP